jgi:hypothetical protein
MKDRTPTAEEIDSLVAGEHHAVVGQIAEKYAEKYKRLRKLAEAVVSAKDDSKDWGELSEAIGRLGDMLRDN